MIASTQTIRIASTLPLVLAAVAGAFSRAADQSTSSRRSFAGSANTPSPQPVSSRNSGAQGAIGSASPGSRGVGSDSSSSDLDSLGSSDSGSVTGEFNIGRDGKPLTPELADLGAKI